MANYDNNNSGVLFKNDKKTTEKHPDYKGSCEVNGVEMWLSAWVRTSQNGNKFMSLAFTPKDEDEKPKRPAPVEDEVEDDDLPF